MSSVWAHGAVAGGRDGSPTAELEGVLVELMYGDVAEKPSLRSAVEGCEVVFHLAGIRRAPSRELFFRVNAEGTRNLCEAMGQAKQRQRLVLCSSPGAPAPSNRSKIPSPNPPDARQGGSRSRRGVC